MFFCPNCGGDLSVQDTSISNFSVVYLTVRCVGCGYKKEIEGLTEQAALGSLREFTTRNRARGRRENVRQVV